MDANRIVRVECRTCGGHHNYHRPKNGPPEAPSTPRTPRSIGKPAAAASGVRQPRHTYADQTERERTNLWQKTVLGQPITNFKPYRATATFQSGDLVRHSKFGDGYIVRVIDRQKVEAMFKDGARTLAQALDA